MPSLLYLIIAVYAPIGAVIGEWVGSSQGLGYLMWQTDVKTDYVCRLVYAGLPVNEFVAGHRYDKTRF